MGVIPNYLKRLAAIVRPRPATAAAVSADADGLRIGGVRVSWSDMRRLHAYKRDVYVGDLLCLAILAAEGQAFEINEESPGWNEAGDAIERHLPGSLPHAEWALRLLTTDPGQSVAIYPASGTRLPGQSR